VIHFALDFKKQNDRWPRVAVTTFTRKATQELSERLVKLAMTDFPEALEFVSSTQFLKVSTIHGILDRFLKEHGHSVGLTSDFGYMKESEANHVAKKTLRDLAMNAAKYEPVFSSYSFTQLNELLQESLEHDLEGFTPLTESHLKKMLGEELAFWKGELGNFLAHARDVEVGEKLRGIWNKLEKVEPLLTPEKWSTAFQHVGEVIDGITLTGASTKKEPGASLYKAFKDLWDDFKKLSSSKYDPASFANLDKINRGFALLRDDFRLQIEHLKKTNRRIEMSDLENFSAQIVRNFPEAAAVFSADTDFWLIDEFQDTSPQQVLLLDALIGRKPYYLVGDPQQSIYLFRGARAEVFRDRVARLQKEGGRYEVLDTNYRSSPSLLALINDLSTGLGPQFQSMKPDSSKERPSLSPEGRFVLISKDSEDPEASELESLYQHILRLRDRGIAYENMAVLGNQNKQLELIGAFLTKRGLPVHLHSSGLFWLRREVQDALALLKFFVNPYDDFNLMRLLRAPFLAIADQDIVDRLAIREKSVWEALQTFDKSGEGHASIGKLLHLFEHRQKLGITVGFQRSLEGLGFFDLHLRADPSGRAEGNLWKFIHLLRNFERERGANFVRFIKDAERARSAERTPDAPGAIEPDKINIMTVHAAKGLQFDCVLLPFLGKSPKQENMLSFTVDEARKIWSVRAPATENDLKTSSSLFETSVIEDLRGRHAEEDLRKFYVAYTRAKQHLYFSWQQPPGKASWALYLQNFDLQPGRHSKNGYTYEVFEGVENAGVLAATAAHDDRLVPPVFEGRRVVDWTHAASQKLAVTKLVKEKLKPIQQSAFVKKNQGILFHRLMEIIRYSGYQNMARLLREWFPENTEQVAEALNYIFSLQEPPMLDLIKTGNLEWSFRTRKSGELKEIDGQIDLWGFSGKKLWIVDYKSGGSMQMESALQQLHIYAEAVKDFLSWKGEIHLAVVYPFLKKLHIEEFR